MQKNIISLVFLFLSSIVFALQYRRYDAGLNLPINEKERDVNPQTGNITLGFTDANLPGRGVLNFYLVVSGC